MLYDVKTKIQTDVQYYYIYDYECVFYFDLYFEEPTTPSPSNAPFTNKQCQYSYTFLVAEFVKHTCWSYVTTK